MESHHPTTSFQISLRVSHPVRSCEPKHQVTMSISCDLQLHQGRRNGPTINRAVPASHPKLQPPISSVSQPSRSHLPDCVQTPDHAIISSGLLRIQASVLALPNPLSSQIPSGQPLLPVIPPHRSPPSTAFVNDVFPARPQFPSQPSTRP